MTEYLNIFISICMQKKLLFFVTMKNNWRFHFILQYLTNRDV